MRIYNRWLKKAGIKTKKEKRKARKYARTFLKSNLKYAINNIAFHNNRNDSFVLYSEKII